MFYFGGGIIDANSVCTIPLKIHGSQNCDYGPLQCINGTSHGFQLAGESGYGIYSNRFKHILANGNGGVGIDQKSTGSAYYIGANTWDMCSALNNTSYGMDIDYASGTYNGFWGESNGAAGVHTDNTVMAVFNGGHLESNNSPDASFLGTATNSKGVFVLGTRVTGTISGFTSAVTNGNLFLPATAPTISAKFSFDGDDLLITGGVRVTTGLSLDGLAAIANFIRFNSGSVGALGLGSTGYLQLDPAKAQLRAQKPVALSVAAISQAAGEVGLGTATQTTVGAAGGASALPGAPAGYLRFFIGATEYVLPYWAQA